MTNSPVWRLEQQTRLLDREMSGSLTELSWVGLAPLAAIDLTRRMAAHDELCDAAATLSAAAHARTSTALAAIDQLAAELDGIDQSVINLHRTLGWAMEQEQGAAARGADALAELQDLRETRRTLDELVLPDVT